MRLISDICSAAEFNAVRERLPRAVRRTVPRAARGHRGVIVQAVTAEDLPLATRFACVPAGEDPRIALARLEAQLRGER